MKTQRGFLMLVFLVAFANLNAQYVTTVEATGSDISENLDLEAVASVFGESEDLEDFENRLNDPATQISNLDLNGDGEVDYLRVIETASNETHLVTVQAAIALDKYQDVVVIDVERQVSGETQVQIVGDVYMYGPDYMITPVYVRSPLVVAWFWGPRYRSWYSPYYYGHYPSHFHPWRPVASHTYRTKVHGHINAKNSYHRSSTRNSRFAAGLQQKSRRNDYGAKHPDKSYSNRNEKNNKTSRPVNRSKANSSSKPTNKPAAKPGQKSPGKSKRN
jgi:hypothetical protein